MIEELSYEVCELQSHNEILLRDIANLKKENEALRGQLHTCSQYTGPFIMLMLVQLIMLHLCLFL